MLDNIEQQEPAENSDITIQDLVSVVNIINLMSERGAFKASELSSVGIIYDRITKFINTVQTTQTAKSNGDNENDSE